MKKFVLPVVSMVLFYSCQNENGKDRRRIVTDGPTTPANSRFIPKDSANKMILSYLESTNYTVNDTDLQSIVIDVKQLRRYIDSMPASANITNVKLMFGHTLDYINSGHGNHYVGYRSGKLTLIISAYGANGDYIYYDNNQVIDFGLPCPSNCPPGNAASPLLQ